MTHPITEQAVFACVTLTILDHAGRRWLTAEEIGRAPITADAGMLMLEDGK